LEQQVVRTATLEPSKMAAQVSGDSSSDDDDLDDDDGDDANATVANKDGDDGKEKDDDDDDESTEKASTEDDEDAHGLVQWGQNFSLCVLPLPLLPPSMIYMDFLHLTSSSCAVT